MKNLFLGAHDGKWDHENHPVKWLRYEAEIKRIRGINMIRFPLEHYPWNYRD